MHRMDQLVEDLVDSSSLESGVLSIRKRWHELSAIVAEALETQELAAAHKSIALRSEVPRDPLRVYCDRHRLLQVLANLFENAVEHTPSGGSIELTVHRAEADILFSVTDTGCGIATEDLSRIFDRYWRARTGKRGRSRGTGLGLYICRGIVEAHGGKIWAHSQLHNGCTLSFTIPSEVPGRRPTG